MRPIGIHEEYDVTSQVGDSLLSNNFEENMKTVNKMDVTFMTLALADFSAATAFLVSHDYPVFGGFVALGVVLVYLYHKFGN